MTCPHYTYAYIPPNRAPLRNNRRAPPTTVLLYALRLPPSLYLPILYLPSLWKIQRATIAYQSPAHNRIADPYDLGLCFSVSLPSPPSSLPIEGTTDRARRGSTSYF
ncbi:hypothetical protein L2E82_15378 [Cichorium intybus]|uniref:Uncharacterized protein n=1 Tax=Cichorium intybus TaxID=13427 RepID=A0ACB9F2K9_CICIN|nr:hypothetical protein L2E82_15378 [Cichorium intybus]